MHGPFGEDGRVQALLDLLGLPYVGSDSFASALAMDKPRTKDVYRARGVPTPKAAVLELDGTTPGALAEVVAGKFPSPWVLKTPRLGSSVGVEIVARREDLEGAVLRVAGIDGTLLVEEFVRGREFTAPVLDLKAEGGPRGLPVIEIVIKTAHFFNYQNKYDGSTAEVCPAEIPEELEQRIRAIGVAAHRALGCRGYSRTDVMVTAGGAAYALETNTLPGLTDQSLFPRAARVAGLSYTALVSALLDDALARGPA
jgi:D-alanine-D-alanine ligase